MSDSTGFAHIAGGAFLMGSDIGANPALRTLPLSRDYLSYISSVEPVHEVTVSGFSMAKYPVTQKEWLELMSTTVRQQQDKASETLLMYGEGDNYPIYYVSWFEAIEFCNRLSQKEGLTPVYTVNETNYGTDATWNHGANGYRLPTEAEWEYAARGGNGSPGNFEYAGSNDVDEVAWYIENSGENTHPVGTKKANGLGLYDMSGNVWEWCWDWYGNYSDNAQTDPVGVSSGYYRVMRGGSWYNMRVPFLLSTLRGKGFSYHRNARIGFRIVRDLQ